MMTVDGFYHHEHLSIHRYASIFRGSAVILQSVAESNLIQEVSSTGRGVRWMESSLDISYVAVPV